MSKIITLIFIYSIEGQPANTDKSNTSKNLIIDVCHQSVTGFIQCYQCRNPARIKPTYVALNVQISYIFYYTIVPKFSNTAVIIC